MATKINDPETIKAIDGLQKFLEKVPVRNRVEILEDATEFCKVTARDYLWKKIKRRSLSLIEVAEIIKCAKNHGFTPEAFQQANQIANELIQATA